MNLAQKIARQRRARIIERRLSRLRLRVFDFEDAGLTDKFDRVVNRLIGTRRTLLNFQIQK